MVLINLLFHFEQNIKPVAGAEMTSVPNQAMVLHQLSSHLFTVAVVAILTLYF